MVMTEGQPITLGDVRVTPYAIPGRTPGSMGLMFPVKGDGQTHMAAMYAGTIRGAGAISDEGLQQYMKSIAHFREETKAKVKSSFRTIRYSITSPRSWRSPRVAKRVSPMPRRRRGKLSEVPGRNERVHAGQYRPPQGVSESETAY